MAQVRDALAVRPTSVVIRYVPAPIGFVVEMASVDGEPALPPSIDGPYAEVAWSTSPEDKCRCEILHADEEMRGKLRLIRLDFVRSLQALGAITRERGDEIVGEPLVAPVG